MGGNCLDVLEEIWRDTEYEHTCVLNNDKQFDEGEAVETQRARRFSTLQILKGSTGNGWVKLLCMTSV